MILQAIHPPKPQVTIVDSDDNSYCPSTDTEEPTTEVDRGDTEVPPAKRVRQESGFLRQESQNASQVRLPCNLQAISQIQKYISKSLMGQDIGRDTSLCVLGSALSLQRTHLEAKGKASKEKQSSIAPAKVREQVCKLYHISIPT